MDKALKLALFLLLSLSCLGQGTPVGTPTICTPVVSTTTPTCTRNGVVKHDAYIIAQVLSANGFNGSDTASNGDTIRGPTGNTAFGLGYVCDSAGGNVTITVNLSGSTNTNLIVIISEFSGILASTAPGCLDVESPSMAGSYQSVTTTNANDFVIAPLLCQNSSSALYTAGTGWTLSGAGTSIQAGGGSTSAALEFQNQTMTGTITPAPFNGFTTGTCSSGTIALKQGVTPPANTIAILPPMMGR